MLTKCSSDVLTVCQNLICIDFPPSGQEVSQAGMDDICRQ